MYQRTEISFLLLKISPESNTTDKSDILRRLDVFSGSDFNSTVKKLVLPHLSRAGIDKTRNKLLIWKALKDYLT